MAHAARAPQVLAAISVVQLESLAESIFDFVCSDKTHSKTAIARCFFCDCDHIFSQSMMFILLINTFAN